MLTYFQISLYSLWKLNAHQQCMLAQGQATVRLSMKEEREKGLRVIVNRFSREEEVRQTVTMGGAGELHREP